MKILQIVPYYAPAWGYGGPPKVMFEIAKRLVMRGHRVIVYTTDVLDSTQRLQLKEEVIEGVKIIRFKNVSNKLAWRHRKFFPMGFRTFLNSTVRNFDIVHISGVRSYLHIVSIKIIENNKVPYVIDAHGALPTQSLLTRLISPLYDAMFTGPMISKASLLIGQTEHEKNEYLQYGGLKEQISIIPLPINLGEFEKLPAKGIFRKKYSIPSDMKIMLFLGRIHKVKGLDFLIHTFKKVRQQYEKVILVIVGRDNGYLRVLEGLIKEAGIGDGVIITGPLYGYDRIPAYVDADLFINTPSCYEETATASLEACACYTPPLVTRQAEIPWLEEYRAGFCLESQEEQFVTRILELLTDQEKVKSYSLNARRLVEERFDSHKVIEEIERKFLSVI